MDNQFLKKLLDVYIKTHYVNENKTLYRSQQISINKKTKEKELVSFSERRDDINERYSYSYSCKHISASCAPSKTKESKNELIDDFIKGVKDNQTFSEYLLSLIDESGESDVDIYKRAGIDRRLFSKIRSNAEYQPSKNTIFALAISLKLDYKKTSKLLNKAGYEFSNNKLTDIIIMFCIHNKIYDLYQVDSFLIEYNQKPIASTL